MKTFLRNMANPAFPSLRGQQEERWLKNFLNATKRA